MKLKNYMKLLNQLTVDHPECMEFDVITSKDDEGNGFNRVYYAPSIGHFDGEYNFHANNPEKESPEKVNAICLN